MMILFCNNCTFRCERGLFFQPGAYHACWLEKDSKITGYKETGILKECEMIDPKKVQKYDSSLHLVVGDHVIFKSHGVGVIVRTSKIDPVATVKFKSETIDLPKETLSPKCPHALKGCAKAKDCQNSLDDKSCGIAKYFEFLNENF